MTSNGALLAVVLLVATAGGVFALSAGVSPAGDAAEPTATSTPTPAPTLAAAIGAALVWVVSRRRDASRRELGPARP